MITIMVSSDGRFTFKPEDCGKVVIFNYSEDGSTVPTIAVYDSRDRLIPIAGNNN